jgi:ATP-dependent Clp protease ATP-binding subunit ClpX
MVRKRKPYACSFCGRHVDQVKRMIGGLWSVVISNQCVELCNLIIAKKAE